MVEDETPFELASIAIFKMFNEWEAKGMYRILACSVADQDPVGSASFGRIRILGYKIDI
jgi:hypothetical protein